MSTMISEKLDLKSLQDVKLVRPSRQEAEDAVRTLIAWAGDDVTREGLLDTPKRVIKAFEELYGGYDTDPGQHLERTFQEVSGYKDIVLMRDIHFYSHCEHHMVPIIGKATIGYLPTDRVVGLSKIARVVNDYGRRLQTQENMTAQITQAINEHLRPKGLAVMLECEHMCMSMRGIRLRGTTTTTHNFSGVFASDQEERKRFFELLRC